MKLYADIKELACPACGRAARPGDLLNVNIAFGHGRHLRAAFRCGACDERFETESLGPDTGGHQAEQKDETERLRQLGTKAGAATFLAALRQAETESGPGGT